MWSSRTSPGALQQTPRTEFQAPEHLEELSSSLQRPNFELPNTSRSSPADSKDRISSSRTPRGALQQPPRTEFRAPEHLEELSRSLPGPNAELPNISRSWQAASKERISSSQASKPGRKQAKQRKASKQTTEQASKQSNEQTSKRANEQASKRASEHTTKRTNKQASKRSAGCPEGLAIIVFLTLAMLAPSLPPPRSRRS